MKLGRYLRSIILDEVGKRGQEILLNSKVGVIGAGGLGCPIILYLAAAGIGNITIVDFDKVNLIDLQRQVIFTESDIGEYKVFAAKKNIEKLNSQIKINSVNMMLNKDNINYFVELFKDFDCIVDATDNIESRIIIDEMVKRINLERKNKKLYWVMGAVYKFEGMVSVLDSIKFSYKKVFIKNGDLRNRVSTCQEVGILPTVTAVIGTIQANEVIKILLNSSQEDLCGVKAPALFEILLGKLLIINLKTMKFDIIFLK